MATIQIGVDLATAGRLLRRWRHGGTRDPNQPIMATQASPLFATSRCPHVCEFSIAAIWADERLARSGRRMGIGWGTQPSAPSD